MSSYSPRCFDVRNITEAKAIILTPDEGSTEERWAKETPYLSALMYQHLWFQPWHLVLDYGCGIGRLSKAMIDDYGCTVLGVDQSVSMRALACAYVESDRFAVCAPASPFLLPGEVDRAIAVWVLQHIPDVEGAIDSLAASLRVGGTLFVVNTKSRFLPVNGGKWEDDGKDVRGLLNVRFHEQAYGALDPKQTSLGMSRHAFWGVYRRRD